MKLKINTIRIRIRSNEGEEAKNHSEGGKKQKLVSKRKAKWALFAHVLNLIHIHANALTYSFTLL